MRSGDVTGNIGVTPCQRDVTGRVATCQNGFSFTRGTSATKKATPEESTESPKPA